MEQRDNDARSIGEVTVTVTPRAVPVIVSDGDTDGATGYCRCGACGEAIDPWDKYCRHCGAGVQR